MNRSIVWLIGHASRFVPVLVVGVVVALTWHTLRQVHPRDITAAMRTMSSAWLTVAAAITVVNVGVMGLYDVVAFRHECLNALLVFLEGLAQHIDAFEPKPVKEGDSSFLKTVWKYDCNPPEYKVKDGTPIKFASP